MITDAHALGEALRLGLSMIVLMLVISHVVLPSLTEGLRQRFFFIRRSLFREMAAGKIDRNDPVFCRMQETLNFLIDRTERISVTRTLALAILIRRPKDLVVLNDHIRSMKDPVARATMERHFTLYGDAILGHMLLRSVLLWPLFLLIFLVAVVIVMVFGQRKQVEQQQTRMRQRIVRRVEVDLDDDWKGGGLPSAA